MVTDAGRGWNTNVRKLLWLARAGKLGVVAASVRRWLYSDASGTGLQRGLETPIDARRPRHALTVRPIRSQEQAVFTDTSGVHGDAALVRVNARHLFATELETCYVALVEDGAPCYIQFLVLPDQNGKFTEAFGELVPPLEPDEALLEFAFTLERYRALGVMPYVVAELAEEAKRCGALRLLTWVPEGNPHVLRYFERIGFDPFAIRTERYRFFRRSVRVRRTRFETA